MAGNVSNAAIILKIGDQKMNNSNLIQIIADILTYLTTDNEVLVLKLRELAETLEDLTNFRYQTQIELSMTRLSILRKRLFLEENETDPIETEIYAEATRLQNLIVDDEVKSYDVKTGLEV